MTKKINPKDQSEALSNARLQFLFRNKEELEKLRKLASREQKKRDEIATALASIGGKIDPERKKQWDFFYKHSKNTPDKADAEYIKKVGIPKAATAVWRWADYSMELEYQRMA